jgi:hypothetical protein
MSKNNILKMMEPDFWKMISEVSWGKTSTSSSAINNKLKVNYPPYKSNYFKEIAFELASNLANAYIESVRKINHYTVVVAAYEALARGKSAYEQFVDDPSKLSQIIENTDTSNVDGLFIFAIPSEDDYYQSVINPQDILDDE